MAPQALLLALALVVGLVAGAPPASRADVLELAALHALVWLVVANAIGVLLALLLVAPGLASALGPLTYGRWVPAHLDLQLYGWCSLPLVALLMRWLLPERAVGRAPARALALWSAALGAGAAWWLGGHSSGKLFLEWSGAPRLLFAAALLALEIVLVAGFLRSGPRPRVEWMLGGALLAALAVVPFVLFWAAKPEVYPPINPDSGGPTGVSLLGSTLGIVALFLLAPPLAGLRPRRTGRALAIAVVLALHLAVFSLLELLARAGTGSASHRDPVQVAALASLVVWWPLVARYLRGFDLPRETRPWQIAFAIWAAVLVATGVTTFLPGLLDRLKFTNALVAHAHLAMAGMASSFLVLVLQLVLRDGRLRSVFRERTAFIAWHAGTAVMVGSLVALGALEAADPGRLFRPDPASDLLYLARLGGGIAMLVASARWLGAAQGATQGATIETRVAAALRPSAAATAGALRRKEGRCQS